MKKIFAVIFSILILVASSAVFAPSAFVIATKSNMMTVYLKEKIIFSKDSKKSSTILTNGQDSREKIRLPIVMYHKISIDKKGTYIVNQWQLESDLIAFQKAGYTTVFPSEIISYVKQGKKLPSKPLLLTFDDGHYNNLCYALPLLKKYNVKALMNIIGQFSNNSSLVGDSNPAYSHVTWQQIKELYDSGFFEIGNHSYNMHNYKPRFGIIQKKNETSEEYYTCLKEDIGKLQNKLRLCAGVIPKVFAWPFGEYSTNATNILLSMGFEMFLTCNEGVSFIKKNNPSSLIQLKRINRNGLFSTQELINKLSL
ncbi:MAG: polysaccharide deacetylase family protein [Clostridia bacterium]|nr:polysaccharide deacetylase family protein [Clostridia bacterium]